MEEAAKGAKRRVNVVTKRVTMAVDSDKEEEEEESATRERRAGGGGERCC